MTNEFIRALRALHEKAKAGTLSPSEKAQYIERRDELSRLMVVAQNINHGGKTLRSNLRIAQLIKVELAVTTGEKPYKTVTVDLASGGFAVLMPMSQPLGKIVAFSMTLPALAGGTEPITGTGKVASSRAHGGLFRVSFHFAEMAPRHREHLEIVIIDYVLQRFA